MTKASIERKAAEAHVELLCDDETEAWLHCQECGWTWAVAVRVTPKGRCLPRGTCPRCGGR